MFYLSNIFGIEFYHSQLVNLLSLCHIVKVSFWVYKPINRGDTQSKPLDCNSCGQPKTRSNLKPFNTTFMSELFQNILSGHFCRCKELKNEVIFESVTSWKMQRKNRKYLLCLIFKCRYQQSTLQIKISGFDNFPSSWELYGRPIGLAFYSSYNTN